MASGWIVDGPGIASKVKSASLSSSLQTNDCGACIQCPNCFYRIDNSNVLVPWPGLPKGVKFEPTDEDIIEFLEAKCGIGGSEPHVLIDEFIRPVTEDVGINYTHPKNLPGANKDGVGAFFYHKTVQAYGTGQRKRRKITPTCLNEEPVRWHKTGKTKNVFLKGVKRGCKKIMVLYKSARKGLKPVKSNWVLHQYHLGTEGEEKGEYVVSKVTYQQEKVKDESESSGVVRGGGGGPTTPMTNTPTPPVVAENGEEAFDDVKTFDPFSEGLNSIPEAALETMWSKKARMEDDVAVNLSEDNLTCNESIEASSLWENQLLPHPSFGELDGFALSDLDNVDLETQPDLLTVRSVNLVQDESESSGMVRGGGGGPTTPITNTPTPPVVAENGEEAFDDVKTFDPFAEGLNSIPEAALEKMWSKKARMEEDVAVNLSEDNLTCNESIEASSLWENQLHPNPSFGELDGFALSDLDNVDLGTSPDFLTLASQDSLLNWMGWL